MPRVIDIYNYTDEIAPFSSQQEWDNSGLLVGNENCEVKKALVALDATKELIFAAKKAECQLVITHHPIIFHPLKSLTGGAAYEAARNGIAVISAHTCYDCADRGVSDILAEKLGLSDIKKSDSRILSYGKIETICARALAERVKNILGGEVGFCGEKENINTVAVCGGAGADYMPEAKALGADAFVTGEAGHHDFLDAEEIGMTLITAGHFETEVISVKPLAERLKNKFPDVSFEVFSQTSPIKHA